MTKTIRTTRTTDAKAAGAALLLSAWALLTMAGCTGADDGAGRGTALTAQPVVFSAGMGTADTRTAATTDNVWPDGTRLTVSNRTNPADAATGDAHVYVTGASSTEAAGTAVAVTPEDGYKLFYWPVDDPEWKFTGWYPAGDVPVTSLTVGADQRVSAGSEGITEEAYQAFDLLYCPPVTATFWASVPLVFHHMLSRVSITVNSNLTERKEAVEAVAFGAGRLSLGGTLTLPEEPGNGKAQWTMTGTADKSISMRNRTTDTDRAGYTYHFECMALPQTLAAGLALVDITTSGSDDGTRTYTYTHTAALTLKAGYHYTFSLDISEQGTVTPADVKVEPWDGTPAGVPGTAVIPDNSY